MVETPDWSNPATVIAGIFFGTITFIMIAGRMAITFVALGGLGGLLMVGAIGFTVFKIFTEK